MTGFSNSSNKLKNLPKLFAGLMPNGSVSASCIMPIVIGMVGGCCSASSLIDMLVSMALLLMMAPVAVVRDGAVVNRHAVTSLLCFSCTTFLLAIINECCEWCL